jgi:hypothetical protein
MYGETGAAMRQELAALLHQHRIQQRLAGPDTYPGAATLSAGDREQLGRLIRRYRQTILTWSSQALEAAMPLSFSATNRGPANPFRTTPPDRGPVVALARALDYTRSQSGAPIADLDLLTTATDNPLAEHWRHAARAAALAEHDTGGPLLASRLAVPQARALAGDVAAITQALIVLDQRYARIPGWQHLAQPQRLGWAALACALDVNLGEPDYTVDQAGWRPRVKPIAGPAKPGVLGVLQAEHNLLVRLGTQPSALNLRRVVDSQRIVSDQLVPFAARIDERLARRWAERAATYSLIQQQLRCLGGQLGGGRPAVAEAANAMARLRALPRDTIIEPRILTAFQTVLTRLDGRIADIVEDGIQRGAYLRRLTTSELSAETRNLVHRPEQKYVPLTRATDLEVLRTVHERLRPTRPNTETPGPGRSRAALHAALVHRPASEGVTSDAPGL